MFLYSHEAKGSWHSRIHTSCYFLSLHIFNSQEISYLEPGNLKNIQYSYGRLHFWTSVKKIFLKYLHL